MVQHLPEASVSSGNDIPTDDWRQEISDISVYGVRSESADLRCCFTADDYHLGRRNWPQVEVKDFRQRMFLG